MRLHDVSTEAHDAPFGAAREQIRSRLWHPSAALGEAGRMVVVGVKLVDRTSARAAEYAERIPAVARKAVHAAMGSGTEVASSWRAAVPELPLDVVVGDDVVTAIEGAVRVELARPGVHEVVVVLARRRGADAVGTTLRGLVGALRQIEGATPVVLPPLLAP